MSPGPRLDRALDLVRFLRAECPWDAKQTPESLVPFLIEETFEVAAAIRGGDRAGLGDELGDLLLNLAFQIVIGEERRDFDAETVVLGLERKMRRRHPHLYGDGEAVSWEESKRREGGDRTASRLEAVSAGLEPLLRALKLQEGAGEVGFDWKEPTGALTKLFEEVEELKAAAIDPTQDQESVREELGDVLFSVVNVARLLGISPGEALTESNRKFERRFAVVEARVAASGRDWSTFSLEELDRFWDAAKRDERSD